MRPQSCKSKGRRFQQRIARDIVDAFPHLQEDDAISTSMGAGGEDIRLSTAARKALPISIECKCQEKLNVWACLEQARSNTPAGATPCLIFSRNRSPTYAVVPWETLLALYRTLYHSGTDGIPTGLSDILISLEPYVGTEVRKRRRDEENWTHDADCAAPTTTTCENGTRDGTEEGDGTYQGE